MASTRGGLPKVNQPAIFLILIGIDKPAAQLRKYKKLERFISSRPSRTFAAFCENLYSNGEELIDSKALGHDAGYSRDVAVRDCSGRYDCGNRGKSKRRGVQRLDQRERDGYRDVFRGSDQYPTYRLGQQPVQPRHHVRADRKSTR